MMKLIKKAPVIWCTLLALIMYTSSCKEDEYYARPDSLEPVIYKQLEEKGNFTNYLQCLDIAGYKDVLNRAGYWTVFAPTDEAFSTYLSENNFSSVTAMDTTLISDIVKYSIIYNSYNKERLDDFQSSDSADWIDDMAFKRRTAYYEWVHDEEVEGETRKILNVNGVGPEESPSQSIRIEDYNNKHIPYFTDAFFAKKNLPTSDYNYFYPTTEFSGFNVVNAKVSETDLYAENGVIHIVDKVITPLPSILDYLAKNPEYSEFYELFTKYLVEYITAPPSIINKYELATGKRDELLGKFFPLLHLAPNCENFLKYGLGEEHDAQINGWTMFAPTNAAVQDFYSNKLLEHYNSLEEIPAQVIAEFVNAHLFRTTVWPSKFDVTVNPFGEPARFDKDANVVEKKIGSNGFFYGVDKIQETDGFYTLLGDIYLDPDYSLMLQALYTTGLYAIVKNTNLSFTVFMIDNDGFEDIGLSYNDVLNSWSLDNNFLGSSATQALNRLINMHIIVNNVFDDFSGTGYLQTYGDEFIRYSGGYLWGPGNIQKGNVLIPKDKKERSNGNSFVLNNLISYTSNNIGFDLENTTYYSRFFEYLEKSAASLPGFLYDAAKLEISNFSISDPNTLLVPCDTAIDGAIRDGYLPPITAQAFTDAEQDMVAKFIWYHSLNGVTIVPELELNGDVKTLYKTVDGSTYVTVNNEGGEILCFDTQGNTVKAINPQNTDYSKLGNNAVIHLVDNYLRY